MSFRDKVLPREQLAAWADARRAAGQRIAATNGCFDILHLGHVTYLEAARAQADILIVAVNADASVRAIKGPNRPVNTEGDRAAVLAALASVDAVHIFPEDDARAFLTAVRPDVYVKGGDYTLDTINQPERRLVESFGGRVVVLGGVPGRSTTNTLARMAAK